MIPSLAMLVGLLQVAGTPLPARATRAPDPVRIWRTDSTAYVTLREPANLLVLHVDAIGRIRVLFPAGPDDDSGLLTSDTLVAIPLPPAAESNPATFIAVRSRWPFDFTDLRLGATWNYQDALLLLPTAGDPLAAALDIAERVTDGRPFDLGSATYSRTGTAVARGPVRAPDVCLSCVRRGTVVAEVSRGPIQNSVDCSNASITNAFCGVNSGTVSITSTPAPPATVVYQPAPAPQPVYVPYYVPFVVDDGFRVPHHRDITPAPVPSSSASPSTGMAFPVRSSLVVPSRSLLQTVRTMRH